MSAYEAARIERIRRNKERLASLGLEGSSKDGRRGSTSSGGTLLSAHTAELERKKEERRKKREQRKKELAEMRESDRRSSSRKRKKISYAEIKETSISGKKADGTKLSTSNREVSKWRTEKPREKRVPLFIFKELRRIESDRKKNLKRAERNNRAADIEYRFAKKNAERVDKAMRRREEMEQQKRQWMERQQEKKELQEFFQAIDDRKQDLVQARSAFDHERFVSISLVSCICLFCISIVTTFLSICRTHHLQLVLKHARASLNATYIAPYNRPRCNGDLGIIWTTVVPRWMRSFDSLQPSWTPRDTWMFCCCRDVQTMRELLLI